MPNKSPKKLPEAFFAAEDGVCAGEGLLLDVTGVTVVAAVDLLVVGV
jgi:hypothetical protein